MNNKVIYTAIFGKYDKLKEPEVIPAGFDFICFTDQDFESKVWQIRKVEKEFKDPTRCARQIKVRPHKYLSEYEYSIWVDGNVVVNGDLNILLDKYLQNYDMAVFDHAENKMDPRNCVYKEASEILRQNKYNYKDDPEVISQQMGKYREEGYPENNGLLHSAVLFRKHNSPGIIEAMETWWSEIKNYSRRDQLSFNYVAWKHNLNFYLIKEDLRKFKYFKYKKHKNLCWRVINKMKVVCKKIGF